MAMSVNDVSTYLLDAMAQAISEKGSACLVLSGGSSPVPVFAALAQTDFAWDKVTMTLVDERNVPPTHSDSNHALIRDNLLQGAAAKAHFIPLYDNDEAFAQIGVGDVALLGMGTDGHFASLFPDMIGDETAFSLSAKPAIIKTGPQGSPVHPRISMNLSLIAQIPHCCLLLPNTEKSALFESAKTDDSLPVHYLHKALGDRLTIFA